MDLGKYLRQIPDFPKPGILFEDITPLLKSPEAFAFVISRFESLLDGVKVDAIAAVESRGFLFAAPLALQMRVPFVPLRKPGKLPYDTISFEYALEYGTNTLEIHRDAVAAGQSVVIVDDLLATGGTAQASCRLVEKLGARVSKLLFVIELVSLNGKGLLKDYEVSALVGCQ